MKTLTIEKAKKRTQKFLGRGGAFERFRDQLEKAKKELYDYFYNGGPRPSWLASFDMIPTGNSKTKLPTFGTYAGYGCRAACPGCYAMAGFYVTDGVIKGRARRVALLETAPALFWSIFEKNLKARIKAGFDTVRLFDAGDVSGRDFLVKLSDVARRFPGVTFYGYTKNFDILDAVELPKNVVFMRSHFLTPPAGEDRAVLKCPGGNCAGCKLCAGGALVWAPLHE